MGEWAARRQADVLLYLGAFLLVISALIFASSRDEVLFGGWRVVLLAAYTAGFIAFGLLLRRWPRVREAGPVFLAIGAFMTPLNFLLLYNEVLSDREVPASLVWFLGSSYSTAFYAFLFARGFGRLYAAPAGASLLSAWGALAVTVGVPFEWAGVWWMVFALGGVGVLERARRWSPITAGAVGTIAGLAVLFAHLVPALVDGPPEHRWQLPVTHALLLVMGVVVGGPRRPTETLVASVLLAVSMAWAVIWALEWPAQWYNFPPLIAAAMLLTARLRREDSGPWHGRAMSTLIAAGALSPVVFTGAHVDGDSGVAAVAFLGSSALCGVIAWRNTTDGVFTVDPAATEPFTSGSPTLPLERIAFGWAGFGALLVAIAFAQRAFGISAPDTGWAYAAIGVVASAAVVVATRHAGALLWVTLPAVLLVTAVSMYPVEQSTGHDAIFVGVAAAHTAVAFAVLRRWSLAVTSVALGMGALAALWESQSWAWWVLAGGYAAISVAFFAVLTPLRRYATPGPGESELLVGAQALSWLPLAAAVVTATVALDARVTGEAIEVSTTVEYRVLVLVVLAFAPMIAFEAWRLRRWEPGVVALAILLGGVAALWPVAGWPTWSLAATFAAAGAGGFVVLSRWRLPGTESRELAVQALSWMAPAAAVITAWSALSGRVESAAVEAATTAEYRALVGTVLLLAPLLAFDAWRFRRWELLAVAQVVLIGAVAAAWPIFDWATWTLAASLAAAGAAGFAPLARWRRGFENARDLAVQALSWLPPAAALFFANVALTHRLDATDIDAVTTVEYRTMVSVVLLFAPLIAYEAWRLRSPELGVAAMIVLLGGIAGLWPAFDWPWWTLAPTFAAGGAGGFLALWRWRRAAADTSEVAIQALSWLPTAAAVVAAAVALNARVEGTAIDAVTTVEYRALVLVVLSAAPLIALEAWRLRRWELGVAPAVVVLAVMAAWWPVFDWAVWLLGVAYSLVGAAVFVALARHRSAGTASRDVAVQAISWSGLVLGPVTVLIAVDLRLDTLDAHPASLVEFRALALLFLPLAGAVAFEGHRLGLRWALLPASALTMVALVLAIATLQPANVQAYTVPTALYLALVGLIARTSEDLHRNIGWHEVVQLAGAGLLVIPQAEQGFDPGGARWGLVLLVEGLALLAVALALNTRWLAVSAVVTLTGVALRFLWVNREADAVPYWVMLAIAGFVLLAVGLTVLLQREWWDRSRTHLLRRWRQDARLDEHAAEAVPTPALLAVLAPVLALLVVANMD